MNSLPADQRGVGRGHERDVPELRGMVLSIGIFFSLMIVGLASTPAGARCTTASSPTACPRRRRDAGRRPAAGRPSLFAAFLGYNPMQHLLGPHVLAALPARAGRDPHRPRLLPVADLRRRSRTALNVAFTFAIVACLVAAAASLLRGGRYTHDDHVALEGEAVEPVPSGIASALQRS